MMMTSGAAPCVDCGTAGGYTGGYRQHPKRARGLCNRCYQAAKDKGTLRSYPLVGPDTNPKPNHPTPWPHLNDVRATGHMLWHDGKRQRQAHAIFPHHFDAAAEIAEARHDAARWLMTHPDAPLLDWPEPGLALFGAANAEVQAA